MKLSELMSYLLDPVLRRNQVVDKQAGTIAFYKPESIESQMVSLAELFSDDNIKSLNISENDLNRYNDYIHQAWLIRDTDFKFENKAYNAAAYYCTQPDNSLRIKKILEKKLFHLKKVNPPPSFYIVPDLERVSEIKVASMQL